MLIHKIMQQPSYLLTPEKKLQDAAELFRSQQMHGAHIVDSQEKVIGVFTSQDLIKALAKGAPLSDPISLYMRSMICAVDKDTPFGDIPWHKTSFLSVSDGQSIVGVLDSSWFKHYVGPAPDDSPEKSGWTVMLDFPDPLFHLEEDGSICWCNYAACLLTGFTFNEILKQPLKSVLTRAGYIVESSSDAPGCILVIRNQDLHLPVSSWSTQAGRQLLLVNNFQEQLFTEEQLAQMTSMTRELKAIIDTSFDGIFITDGQGKVLRVNKAYERITGIRASEVLGRNMSELVDTGYYNQSVTLRIIKTKKTETLIQTVKRGKTIMVTGNPLLDEQGRIVRVVTNVRDVTELHQLQHELKKESELKSRYQQELESLRRSTGKRKHIIIRSKKMCEIYDQAILLSRVDSTVLILGESGVGKEVMANVIHENGPRANKPFIKISCAAIPEQLLESELFGYMPGAFTGALTSGKPGLFEMANQGTLFLDEIGEMPLGLQVKLLRVLQEGSIVRVGGVQSIKVNVRIMAATNRDLEEMVASRQFRSDLYYRLNVVPLNIPPLREREEAIIDFLYHFLSKYNGKYGRSRQLEPDGLDFLVSRQWPGNVRELENAVERIVVMSKTEVINRAEIARILCKSDPSLNSARQNTSSNREQPISSSLRQIVEEAERQAILQALSKYKTSRKVAKALGINQSTVVRKVQKLGISLSDA